MINLNQFHKIISIPNIIIYKKEGIKIKKIYNGRGTGVLQNNYFTRSFCWLIKKRNWLTTLDKTIKDNARITKGRVYLNEWIRARKEYQSMVLNF